MPRFRVGVLLDYVVKATFSRVCGLLLPTVILFCIVGFSYAQVDPAAGMLPFSTHISEQYDSIDPATGNIMLSIPVMSKAGKIPFSFNLQGNFRAFVYEAGNYTSNWSVGDPAFNDQEWGGGGIKGVPSGGIGLLNSTTTYLPCNGSNSEIEQSNFTVTDATGAIHPVSAVLTVQYGPCGMSGGGTAQTIDSSGYTVVVTAANPPVFHLYDRSGNTLSGGLIDPDNVALGVTTTTLNAGTINVAWKTTYTDTLGRTAMTSTIYGDRLSSGTSAPDLYTYTDVNGNSQTVQVNYTLYPHRTNFGCGGNELNNGPVYFPTSVVFLGDGETIGISYESTPGYAGSVTGRLSQITLPSGGYTKFQYSGGSNGINCTSAKSTITRTVNDGNAHNSIWTYTPTAGDTYGNFTVTETDPANNTTTYHFYGEFQTEKVVQNAAGVLSTTITCYNGNNTSQTACIAPQKYLAIFGEITQTDVYTSLGGSSAASLVETIFDGSSQLDNSFGVPVTIKRYDFGATYPPSGTPTSETDITYANISGVTCGSTSVHILDHPCLITTYNSAGAPTSQTRYTYNAGGHATETDKWVGGSSFLKSYAAYQPNGALAYITDVNGAITHFDQGNPAYVCNNLLSTTTTLPITGLSTSQTYDSGCNGPLPTQTTDLNQQPTAYAYNDPFKRVTSVTAPYNGVTTATTNYSYSPTTFEGSLLVNNGSAVDTVYAADGVGRLTSTKNRITPGSSSYDNLAQYSYGWTTGVGAFITKTLPGATAATTTQFDALGRTKTVTDGGGGVTSYTYSSNDVLVAGPSSSRQIEYDGLGRIKSVCEITSSLPGYGNCNPTQNTAAHGYLTTYAYDSPVTNAVTVTQNKLGTSQQRIYYYDGVGRLIQEQNPETGSTYYYYDKASSNPGNGGTYASAGDLIQKIDANGNGTGYVYDSIHRLLSAGQSYNNSPNASATPDRCFIYDSATVNGVTTLNSKGQLAEAYTVMQGAGCGAAKITDEGFSYSPRGELTDVYESTPNSNGYYHTTADYFANGALKDLGGVPGHTNPSSGIGWTFTVDGEGRPLAVTDQTTPADLVTQTSYNSASQPTNVVLGDASAYGGDSYSYDANTGRMTQYSFNVVGAGYANLLYESQALDDASYWVAWGAGVAAPTVVANAAIDPNGAQTADSITYPANPNSGTTVLQQTVTPSVVAGQTFTFSIYLRADSPQTILVGWKTPTTSAYADAEESVTTAWKRFVLSGAVPSGDSSTQIIAFLQGGNSLTSSQTIYAWGAQLQLGSSTNYQQTGNGADPFSVTGNLTWNSNGTLQQLSIFDLFDTANNQTCNYGYDDLSRLSSANCGTAANQSFTYDAFGNIQKTGSPNAFTPTYASNNRINAISGCSPPFNPATAYDADGNLLYDCTNTYTYDAYGKVASINSVPITYDALGRMVENGSGEILYSPIGKLALMTRQITQNIFLPLPGGEQATYTGSTLRFRHYDWLGSSRFESNTADKEYADLAYAPFGETYSVKSNVTTPYISFTGQQPDTVSSLYDFTYREYSPGQGRWISPDPAGSQVMNFSDPQSFNRYAYVLNNPLRYTDPAGLFCYYGTTSDDGKIDFTLPDASDWNSYDYSSSGEAGKRECADNGGAWQEDVYDAIVTANFLPGDTITNDSSDGQLGAPNNGRNCSAGPASAGQYVAATAQVAALTAQFASGLGPTNQTFGPNTATSAVMGQSAGVTEVLGAYMFTGQTSGLYTFGASGAYVAGGNPVAQFVGSFRWSISGGVLSLTNTTSLRSLTYDHGPQYQRGSFPTPGGNIHQTFQIGVTCH